MVIRLLECFVDGFEAQMDNLVDTFGLSDSATHACLLGC